MNLSTIIISACVGIVTSAITAYITTRLKIKEEKEKWRREFALKYAEAQVADSSRAQRIREQFAIGVLIKNPESADREKIFVPPNCRLVVGRAPDSAIVIDNPNVSRYHCAFYADDSQVFIEELGSTNVIYVNGEEISGRRKLKTNDLVSTAQITFRFQKLDSE